MQLFEPWDFEKNNDNSEEYKDWWHWADLFTCDKLLPWVKFNLKRQHGVSKFFEVSEVLDEGQICSRYYNPEF